MFLGVIPCHEPHSGMDGLAMALWALWNSNTFATALQKAVNLLGDADTVSCLASMCYMYRMSLAYRPRMPVLCRDVRRCTESQFD